MILRFTESRKGKLALIEHLLKLAFIEHLLKLALIEHLLNDANCTRYRPTSFHRILLYCVLQIPWGFSGVGVFGLVLFFYKWNTGGNSAWTKSMGSLFR